MPDGPPALDPLTPRPLDPFSLSILIVTWNSARFIRDCLGSIPVALRSSTFVVDNHSRDGTPELVRREFPDVQLIANSTNTGYAHASNQGLETLMEGFKGSRPMTNEQECRMTNSSFVLRHSCFPRPPAPFVLLLNPDTRLPRDGLDKLVSYMDAHPEIGVLAPKLVGPDGAPQPSVRRFPTYGNMLAALFVSAAQYKMKNFDFGRTQEIEQPMASCLLVRTKVLGQTGGLDEQFPMFMNDVDLLKRIRDAGWKIVYAPEVSVWHYLGGSTEQNRKAMISSMHQSLFRYFRKHDRSGWFWLKAVPLAMVIELAALARILAESLRRRSGTKD